MKAISKVIFWPAVAFKMQHTLLGGKAKFGFESKPIFLEYYFCLKFAYSVSSTQPRLSYSLYQNIDSGK